MSRFNVRTALVQFLYLILLSGFGRNRIDGSDIFLKKAAGLDHGSVGFLIISKDLGAEKNGIEIVGPYRFINWGLLGTLVLIADHLHIDIIAPPGPSNHLLVHLRTCIYIAAPESGRHSRDPAHQKHVFLKQA